MRSLVLALMVGVFTAAAAEKPALEFEGAEHRAEWARWPADIQQQLARVLGPAKISSVELRDSYYTTTMFLVPYEVQGYFVVKFKDCAGSSRYLKLLKKRGYIGEQEIWDCDKSYVLEWCYLPEKVQNALAKDSAAILRDARVQVNEWFGQLIFVLKGEKTPRKTVVDLDGNLPSREIESLNWAAVPEKVIDAAFAAVLIDQDKAPRLYKFYDGTIFYRVKGRRNGQDVSLDFAADGTLLKQHAPSTE